MTHKHCPWQPDERIVPLTTGDERVVPLTVRGTSEWDAREPAGPGNPWGRI